MLTHESYPDPSTAPDPTICVSGSAAIAFAGRLALILAVVAVGGSAAGAATYVVNPEGTGDFPTIQAAVLAVADGDTIELADGVFTGAGNRDIEFLGRMITVRSAGADPATCIIDCEGTEVDPHRGFSFRSFEGADSRLEGITIRNGFGLADAPGGDQVGGAVFCERSSPSITRCVFANNVALYGGAIACRDSSCIALVDCNLTGNIAFRGAGLHCDGDCSPTLTDCAFTANSTTPYVDGAGAGVQCANGCSPTLVGCSFTDNTAWRDAGMVCARNCSPVLTGCTFSANTANEGAGGFGGYHNCAAEFTDCVFSDNAVTADVSVCAGGLLASLSELTLTRCEFVNNTVWSTGVEVVGGLSCFLDTPATLTECEFTGNAAGGGTGTYVGAVGCFGGSPLELLRCTFSGNSGDLGGVLCYQECPAVLTNCTFHGNTAGADHGTLTIELSTVTLENTFLADAAAGRAIECLSGDPPTLTCCDIYGNAGGDWVGCIEDQLGVDGNISEDPLFCDPSTGDFALQEDSPCAPFSEPNPECDRIGAWPVGCGTSAAGERDLFGVQGFVLGPSVPNPFDRFTRITFEVPATAYLTPANLQIYDATGRLIRVLVAGSLTPGVHTVRWDGTNQAGARVEAGIYYCRFSIGREQLVRPLVLVD